MAISIFLWRHKKLKSTPPKAIDITFTAEQITNIKQRIVAKLIEQVPGLTADMFEVNIGDSHRDYSMLRIRFANKRLLTWPEIDLRDVIDANYDMFVFWYDADIDSCMGPAEIITNLAGINTAQDKAEIRRLQAMVAELEAENAELRLIPGGPEHLAAKAHFENMQKA